ncbi:MAG: LPXTG cell wall anchor domain-containing protein [Clostridia bacterium]
MKTKKWKRALSVVLAGTMAVTALSAGMTAFAAEDDFYPEGVTAEQAGQAVTTVDTVLNDADLLNLVSGLVNGAQDVVTLPENAENLKDLAEQVVADNLYTDAMVNEVLKLVQVQLGGLLDGLDLGSSLINGAVKTLVGIMNPNLYADKIPDGFAAKEYLDTQTSWDAVDWSQVTWGVDGTADSFYAALGAALNAQNNLLKVLLTNQDYNIVLLVINHIDGYEKVAVPLFEALGVTGYKSVEEYNADTSTEGMLRNILEPIINHVLNVCEAPATGLLELLPNLAEFIVNDGIQAILDSLNIKVSGSLAGTVTGALEDMGIVANEDGAYNLGDILAALAPDLDLSDINGLIKGLIPEGSFNWVDIDFAGLAALKGDAGKVLVWVLEYAGQLVNANADMIKAAIPAIEDQTLAGIVTPIIDKVLTTDPANFAALVINLLAPTDAPVSPYNYPAIEKVDFVYPEGVLYGEDAYAAAPAAIDGLLAGFGLNLADLVGGALYTNDLINSVLSLYDTIAADPTVVEVLATLGINTDFAAVKAAAQAINVTDKASFIDALTTALSPFDDVLALVLAGQDYDVFGYNVKAMDAYNTVVIPLLEVLGCTNVMSYADYQAAVAGGASPLEAILTQALDRVDEILASPVDSIVEILPNLAYFLDSNNLSVMIENAVSPLIQLLSYVDIDAMAVVNDLLKAYNIPAIDDLDNDLAGLLNQVLGLIKINDAPLGIQLPAIDLHVLASYGTAEAYTSAMVIDGQNVQATRIVADKADVTGAVIGYLYSVLADQATVDTIVGLLGENGSMVSGILSGLLGNGEAGFTNALFELLGLPLKGEDGSSEGNENVNTGDTTVAVVAGAAVLAAGAVLLLSRKKKEN